jgi:hypothetical protein
MSIISWALWLFEIPHMCYRSSPSYHIGQYNLVSDFHMVSNTGHVGKLVCNLGPQSLFFAKFEKYCKTNLASITNMSQESKLSYMLLSSMQCR